MHHLKRLLFAFQKRYSNLWPVILLDNQGNVSEIHYNNRTMGPLQAPGHIIIPFYHALKVSLSSFVQYIRRACPFCPCRV